MKKMFLFMGLLSLSAASQAHVAEQEKGVESNVNCVSKEFGARGSVEITHSYSFKSFPNSQYAMQFGSNDSEFDTDGYIVKFNNDSEKLGRFEMALYDKINLFDIPNYQFGSNDTIKDEYSVSYNVRSYVINTEDFVEVESHTGTPRYQSVLVDGKRLEARELLGVKHGDLQKSVDRYHIKMEIPVGRNLKFSCIATVWN